MIIYHKESLYCCASPDKEVHLSTSRYRINEDKDESDVALNINHSFGKEIKTTIIVLCTIFY